MQGVLQSCAGASLTYSSIDDSPLCLALNYCKKGSMHTALKGQGYSFSDRSKIIKQALDMKRRCSCHESCSFFGTCCEDVNTSMYAYVSVVVLVLCVV